MPGGAAIEQPRGIAAAPAIIASEIRRARPGRHHVSTARPATYRPSEDFQCKWTIVGRSAPRSCPNLKVNVKVVYSSTENISQLVADRVNIAIINKLKVSYALSSGKSTVNILNVKVNVDSRSTPELGY